MAKGGKKTSDNLTKTPWKTADKMSPIGDAKVTPAKKVKIKKGK